MPRPTIDEDTLDRLTEIADARAKVPAEHLSPEQKIGFLLDELTDADARANRLSDKVDRLEAKIAELRNEADTNNQLDTNSGINPAGGNNGFSTR